MQDFVRPQYVFFQRKPCFSVCGSRAFITFGFSDLNFMALSLAPWQFLARTYPISRHTHFKHWVIEVLYLWFASGSPKKPEHMPYRFPESWIFLDKTSPTKQTQGMVFLVGYWGLPLKTSLIHQSRRRNMPSASRWSDGIICSRIMSASGGV